MNDVAEPNSGSSFRAIIGFALMAVLLAGAVAGFLYWRQGIGGIDVEDDLAEAADEAVPQQLASPDPSNTPEASASQAVQEAAQVVERVTEQQGGLEQRLAAAEERLSRLSEQSQAAAGNAARAEGILIAFAVRRSIEKGEELGYLADQLRLRFGDGWPNAVNTIISMSRDPVTLDRLIFRLEGLEGELRNDSEEPSLDRLRREISELFIVRRETSPSPQPMRRMERARLFLESGRYESAIEEVQNMPGAPAAERWIADTRRYAATMRAIDLIETGALLDPNRLRSDTGTTVDQPSPVQKSN